MSFVGLTKDRYPHERICLFISAEKSLLCAERVEDRWRTFLSTLWLRSVNNSLPAVGARLTLKLSTLRESVYCLNNLHTPWRLFVWIECMFQPELVCWAFLHLAHTHTFTSTFLLYRSPSPLAFSHDSHFNHFLPAWTPQTSHNAFLHLQACGVLWVRAAFGSSELSGKEQTGEVGGVWVCVFPSWCVNWWWSAELPDGVGKVQIDSLHSSSLRRQTQGPPCTGLCTKENERRVCVSVCLLRNSF